MDNLYKLIEQYKLHLEFLQSNNVYYDEKGYGIIGEIEGVFDIVSRYISFGVGIDNSNSNEYVSN